MFTRTTGLLIVPMWLAAMGWLVAHDLLPTWSAQQPPLLRVSDWLEREGKQSQFAVYYEGDRIGTIWTDYPVLGSASIQSEDVIWIDRLPFDIAPIRVTVRASYTGAGLLDELNVRMESRGPTVHLDGERFQADFSFTLQVGPMQRAFKVPLTDGGVISGIFRPFSQLSDLRVGQTWRMQVFNPVALLTGVGPRFTSHLVEVTRTAAIDTPTGEKQCYIVRSPNATAWVDQNGAVLVQEVVVPGAGRLRIVREEDFDADARHDAQHRRLRPEAH